MQAIDFGTSKGNVSRLLFIFDLPHVTRGEGHTERSEGGNFQHGWRRMETKATRKATRNTSTVTIPNTGAIRLTAVRSYSTTRGVA